MSKPDKSRVTNVRCWYLTLAKYAGNLVAMGEMKKITVEVPVDTLEAAMREDGNLAETVREALRELAHRRASQRLLALDGKVKFAMTWQELRGKDED